MAFHPLKGQFKWIIL